MATDIVGSRMKALNGYGQNGYQGPSSDLPGQRTQVEGPLKTPDSGLSTKTPGDWQTRPVSKEAFPTHPGMKPANGATSFPTNNVRQAVVREKGNTSFQR